MPRGASSRNPTASDPSVNFVPRETSLSARRPHALGRASIPVKPRPTVHRTVSVTWMTAVIPELIHAQKPRLTERWCFYEIKSEGSIPEREPEKRLPLLRKAAGTTHREGKRNKSCMSKSGGGSVAIVVRRSLAPPSTCCAE